MLSNRVLGVDTGKPRSWLHREATLHHVETFLPTTNTHGVRRRPVYHPGFVFAPRGVLSA
jgi:hypothetical protein